MWFMKKHSEIRVEELEELFGDPSDKYTMANSERPHIPYNG
jgi:hypothetical protein